MGIVLKKHYTTDSIGKRLKTACDIYKNNTLKYVQIWADGNKRRTRLYENAFFPFKNGNDAVLEYIPHKSKGRHVWFANSSVSDSLNPFFLKDKLGKGNCILIPHTPKFNVVHTNRKRDINTGSPRDQDTEYKLFEHLASKIKFHQEGTVNLYTYYEPCLSCDYVMIQFSQTYKKININVFFEQAYKPKAKERI